MPLANVNVQLDERLMRRVEALAQRVHVDVNELVGHLVERWLARTSPDCPDISEGEVLREHHLEAAVKAALRDHDISGQMPDAEDAALIAHIRPRSNASALDGSALLRDVLNVHQPEPDFAPADPREYAAWTAEQSRLGHEDFAAGDVVSMEEMQALADSLKAPGFSDGKRKGRSDQ